MYWVYILQCENNSFYTGYTNNLEKRFAAHLNGTASKYTRSFKPICIAQSWQIIGDKSLAMKLEKFIKNLSRKLKEIIISNPDLLLNKSDVIRAATTLSSRAVFSAGSSDFNLSK